MKERVGKHCRRENLLKPEVSSFESPQASFAARSSLPLAGQEAGRDVREERGDGTWWVRESLPIISPI